MKKYRSQTSGLIVEVENNQIINQYFISNGNKIDSDINIPLSIDNTIFGTLENMIRIAKLQEME